MIQVVDQATASKSNLVITPQVHSSNEINYRGGGGVSPQERVKEAKNNMRKKLLGLGKLMAAGKIQDPLKNFEESAVEHPLPVAAKEASSSDI